MHLQTARPQYLGELPPGEPGTRATLHAMRELVKRFKTAGQVRETALALIQGLPPKAYAQEVRALFEYVRDAIRYVRDIHGVETLQTPVATLELEAGDCDDKATLLAALLQSIGHPTRFVAEGYRSPGHYSHVYLQTRVGRPGQWLSLDPTVSTATVGWAPPRRAAARMVVNV
jgi:transglutaminase-like putative cysteine protease